MVPLQKVETEGWMEGNKPKISMYKKSAPPSSPSVRTLSLKSCVRVGNSTGSPALALGVVRVDQIGVLMLFHQINNKTTQVSLLQDFSEPLISYLVWRIMKSQPQCVVIYKLI